MNTSKSTKTTKKRNLKKRVLTKKPNRRRRIRRVVPLRGRKLAAASAKQFKKKFKVIRQNGSSVRVSGRDLIYAIPDDNTSPVQDTTVIAVLSANPVYWKGSRIAALASGYQNYRPIKFKVTYVPIVAVTQQGNVIGGTIWDNGFEVDNVQQSLRTSNGGFLTQCYIPHTTQIRPKTNLQFNLYRVGGAFNQQSNPFVFVAMAIGCKNSSNNRIIPGYFYVTWTFELKNPIGTNGQFTNSGLTTYSTIKPALNTTLVNIDMEGELPFGAYIDIEYENQELQPKYNNTPIELEENTPVWAFQSLGTAAIRSATQKRIIHYNLISTDDYVKMPSDKDQAIIFTKSTEAYYTILIPATNQIRGQYYYAQQADQPTMLANLSQDFGIYLGLTTKTFYETPNSPSTSHIYSVLSYRAPKSEFTIELGLINNLDDKIKKYPKTRIKPIDKVTQLFNQIELDEKLKQEEKKKKIEKRKQLIQQIEEINLEDNLDEEEEKEIKLNDNKSINSKKSKNNKIEQQLPIP